MQGVHFQNTEEHITFGREQLIRSVAAVIVVSLFVAFFIFSFLARRNGLDFCQFYSAPRLSGKDSAQNYITSGCNCNSSQKLPRFTSFTTTLFETLLFMPLTSLLLGQDSMLMLFIYAGFHNRQLARTRLDCDLRTPSLVEYPTLLLATRTYQAIVGLDPALCLVSEVSYT